MSFCKFSDAIFHIIRVEDDGFGTTFVKLFGELSSSGVGVGRGIDIVSVDEFSVGEFALNILSADVGGS
ncbi:hypothetical protein SDC9_149585 [bioreactor metagenome]|uniref:Uncharacterized protein n=1 Tax=bioreactor metagenome TaxID=1076179 RepID=A0A645EML6_9ZZZZ